MWLVTHEHHNQHFVDHIIDFSGESAPTVASDAIGSLFGRPKHRWAIPMPSTFWEDTGDVVVVAPPPYAGGADPGNSNAP
jgi:hypothetical protein